MSTMTLTRPVAMHGRVSPAHRSSTGLAGGVAFALAVLVLLAMLPALAGRPDAAAGAPGPLPAPAPSGYVGDASLTDR